MAYLLSKLTIRKLEDDNRVPQPPEKDIPINFKISIKHATSNAAGTLLFPSTQPSRYFPS